MGRNWASRVRTGLGRRLAVVSRAWLCRIVERAACRAWLCWSARRMASSRVMRAVGAGAAAEGGAAAGCWAEMETGPATSMAARAKTFFITHTSSAAVEQHDVNNGNRGRRDATD